MATDRSGPDPDRDVRRRLPDDVAGDADRAVYVISVAAELAGVHPQTLRIYERKGLVSPSRTAGGSRRYSEREVARLQRIQELTTLGMSLEGAKRALVLEEELAAARHTIAELRAELERARHEAYEAVQRVHRQYRRDLVPVSSSLLPFRPRPRGDR